MTPSQTNGYIISRGRDCQVFTLSIILSVTTLIVAVDIDI
jgi:hypothetical protein